MILYVHIHYPHHIGVFDYIGSCLSKLSRAFVVLVIFSVLLVE